MVLSSHFYSEKKFYHSDIECFTYDIFLLYFRIILQKAVSEKPKTSRIKIIKV